MTNARTADLAQSIEATGKVLSQLHAKQLGLSTPCEDWSVAQVRDHLLRMLVTFGEAFGASLEEPQDGGPNGSTDTVETYKAASARLLEAASAASPDRMVTIPFGTVPAEVATKIATVEALVHGWDVAKATGQHYVCNPAVAERAREVSAALLAQVPAGRSPFAPPVTVEDSAPAIDRLVGLLGRQP
ncbi:TIGR03086 family metal-binding protein [Oryzihumus sp.]|uniref:TIGR03086 family metal-binding protein n=1 Tax=Oryzihumus sp. TaxID=1968903 RepID=UPI002ED9FA22